MKKYNKIYFNVSIFITFFLPMFIPLGPVKEGIFKYQYGFPFQYITIYQMKQGSNWFFSNFFNGNSGIAINPIIIIVNAIIVYFIISYLIKFLNKAVKK